MAVLDETNRASVWSDFMQKISGDREEINLTKPDLRAAVDALDTFLNDNAAALNNAIPQPARSNLTAAQKARLLAYVALRRWGGD